MSTAYTYAPLRSLNLPERAVREPGSARKGFEAERVPGRKPHICFVAPEAWPVLSGDNNVQLVGGAEVQQGFLARAFVQRGYRVSMICLDYGQPDMSVVDGITVHKAYAPDDGLPVVRFFHPRITSMWRAMKRVNADIYYHRSSAALTAVMAHFCRLHGKKSIYAGASDVDFIPGKQEIRYARDRWLFEHGLKRVDGVVVQNPTQLENCRRHYGIDATYIPSTYAPPPGARADRSGCILWVGALRGSKRPDRVIEIARRLPQYRFVMIGRDIGDPRETGNKRNYQEAAKGVTNLELLGFLPYEEADRHFNGARVLLNTSAYEGFPNTFLQAWSRGIPAVGFTDTGSMQRGERVYHYVSDIDEAVARIDRLMSDDLHWQQMSQRAAEHFRERHSVDVVAAAYAQVFSALGSPIR